MRAKVRPQLSRLDQHKGKHRDISLFKMNRQIEAIGQQRLHHQSILILGRVAARPRIYSEALRSKRLWHFGEQGFSLLRGKVKFVGELCECFQRSVH
jgi:hypothetical protein